MSTTFATTASATTPFDLNRFIVVTLFGSVLEPRDDCSKKLWHTVIWLPPKQFPPIGGEERLADGWSTLKFRITLQYQPSVEYARSLLRTDPSIRDIHKRIEEFLKPTIEIRVRNGIKQLKADDFVPADGRKLAEEKIGHTIKTILLQNGITCDASCDLEEPKIGWPQEGQEPQLIAGQEFFESVKTRYHEFFKQQKVLDRRNKDELEKQALEAQERDLERREQREELDRIEGEMDQQRKERDVRFDSELRLIDARAKQQEDIETMDLEAASRTHRMSASEDEKKFLSAETEILELEKKRLLAEEYVRTIGSTVAHEIERAQVENIELRRRAESVVELLKQAELLKVLPQLVERLEQHKQPIEHLSVLQLGEATGDKGVLPGSPVAQLIQALTVVRQVINFLTEHGAKMEDQ